MYIYILVFRKICSKGRAKKQRPSEINQMALKRIDEKECKPAELTALLRDES